MVLAGPVLPQGERGGDKIDALPLQRLGMTKHELLLEEGGIWQKGKCLKSTRYTQKAQGVNQPSNSL